MADSGRSVSIAVLAAWIFTAAPVASGGQLEMLGDFRNMYVAGYDFFPELGRDRYCSRC